MTEQEFSFDQFNFIDIQFGKNELFADTLNVWLHMISEIGGKIDENSNLNSITPLQHYEEYLEKYSMTEKKDQIMSKSSQESIKKFDQLVDEFNANIEKIKSEKDIDFIKNIFNRAIDLVTGNQAQKL